MLLVGLCFLRNIREQTQDDEVVPKWVNQYSDAGIKTVIIRSENNTFGYNIYVHGAILIHQPSQSGLPGNTGFATEEDARHVAEFVSKKRYKNELPPTITIEELQEIEVMNYEKLDEL